MSDLKKETINGVLWSAIEQFSTLGVQMICTLVIARFLTPSDFGIVGMLSIFTAISLCLINSGFKTALIRKNDATDIDYSTILYFNIIIGFAIYIILYFCSPLISKFYNEPLLDTISKFTFLVLPISAFGLIQSTILTKNLKFKILFYCSFIAALISGVIGVVLAILYKDVWAIVIQNLSFYTIQTILLWTLTSWRPLCKFSISSIKRMYGFSISMMFSTLIATIFNNLYVLIIGKLYTPTDLGNYSQAHKLQTIPSNSITEVIQRVSYPVLARFQDNDEMLCNAYKRIIRITFYIVSIIMFILMGTSSQLFDILFNDEWNMAGNFFSILCLNGVFYPLHSINLNILSVKGKGKEFLTLEIVRRAILLSILFISCFFDIQTFVWGQVVYSIIVLFINLFVCGKYIRYKMTEQLKDLMPTFIIGLSVMLFIKYIIPMISIDNTLLFFLQISVGLLIFLIISILFKLYEFYEIVDIIKPYIHK